MKKFLDEIFFPYLDKHNIKHVVHLGDLVDTRKSISYYTSMRMRIDYFQPLIERDIEYYQIVGNHDSFYKHKLEIHSAKELYHDYDIELIDYPQERMVGDCKILFVPWICKDNYERTVDLLNNTTARVVMGHLECSGFQMYKGSIPSHGYNSNLFDHFDRVFTGHFHHPSNSGAVTYIGAAGEYSWSDYNDNRGFSVFDSETLETTFIQNRFRIFKKIFWNDEEVLEPKDYKNCVVKIYVTEKEDHAKFDKFIEALGKSGVISYQIINEQEVEIGDDAEETDCEDTPTTFRSYVETMTGDFNKIRLTGILLDAYQEALRLEN